MFKSSVCTSQVTHFVPIVKTVPVLYEMFEYTVWEKYRDLNVKACGTGGYHKYIMRMACKS
jgi:hypothetical protein